jgi:DNA-directed RNA polymerase specialized sigma24 family protein
MKKIDKLIENFLDTGKVNEQNEYRSHITVGTAEVSYEDFYQMFFPFNRMTSNYPELNEIREIIKRKCLKSADGNVETAKDYCDEVFLNSLSLFFRKGYHFPNTDKLISSVITKVGTGLIDLHRKRTAQKRTPNYFKRMDDEYLERIPSTEEEDKLYTDEMVRQAISQIKNDKYRFAIESKYFNNMSQEDMAEVWEEETGQEDPATNWGVYSSRGRAEFKKNLLRLKQEENEDYISEYVNKLLDL